MQEDVAQAFDTSHWDFISQTMSRMGFGPKLVNGIYWLYSNTTAQCIIGEYLTRSWTLGNETRLPSKCLTVCHNHTSFQRYLDDLADMGQLHGLQILGFKPFPTHANVDDSYFMLQNIAHELQNLMHTLFAFGMASSLNIEFENPSFYHYMLTIDVHCYG